MNTVPAATPVTTPDEFIVAMLVALLYHEPPVPVELRVVVLPVHTVAVPEIVPANGNGLTVTIFVATPVPHAAVTV